MEDLLDLALGFGLEPAGLLDAAGGLLVVDVDQEDPRPGVDGALRVAAVERGLPLVEELADAVGRSPPAPSFHPAGRSPATAAPWRPGRRRARACRGRGTRPGRRSCRNQSRAALRRNLDRQRARPGSRPPVPAGTAPARTDPRRRFPGRTTARGRRTPPGPQEEPPAGGWPPARRSPGGSDRGRAPCRGAWRRRRSAPAAGPRARNQELLDVGLGLHPLLAGADDPHQLRVAARGRRPRARRCAISSWKRRSSRSAWSRVRRSSRRCRRGPPAGRG